MSLMDIENQYCARNYNPLPVVLARGRGAHVWDVAGRRYIDMLSAYSAASLGHCHPRIIATLTAQARRLAIPSRAYYNDRLGSFLKDVCKLTGFAEKLLPNAASAARIAASYSSEGLLWRAAKTPGSRNDGFFPSLSASLLVGGRGAVDLDERLLNSVMKGRIGWRIRPLGVDGSLMRPEKWKVWSL
jgi:hypothetical protein